jgi:hypothetical protein
VVIINIGLQCILIIMMEIIGGQEKSQSEHEHWRQIKQDWSTASFAGSVEKKSIHGGGKYSIHGESCRRGILAAGSDA